MTRYALSIRHYFMQGISPVIRILILSDVICMGAVGLLTPIFAVFIKDTIVDGNLEVVGIAVSIYLVTKSIMQIPAAFLIDQIRGEADDFWALFISSFITALLPLAYLLITTSAELYLVQFLYGFFAAFTFPSFMAIFTRHVDKQKEGIEWGVYFTLNDLAGALSAFLGGIIVTLFGFQTLIVCVVTLGVIATLASYPLRAHMLKA